MELVWTSSVYTLIAFLILMFLLSKYAFGPLMRVMDKRAEIIQDQLKSAEENRKQSEQLLAEQKQSLEQARKEAYEMIEQAKVTSAKQAEEIIENARTEAARLKEEALKDIENEKNKAVAALRSQVSAMSVMIASKIIEKQIDEQSHQELINHYLKEVGDRV